MRIPSRRRPLHTAVLGALLLSVFVVFLSGCMAAPAPPVPATPVAVASPEPTVTPPVFASNDEALAAATAAYSAYLAAGDAAGKVGSESWNAYLAFTTGPEHDGVASSGRAMETEGRSLTGTTSFDSMTVQASSARPDGTWEIRTYLCLDISRSHLLDAADQPVIDTKAPLRWPMVVLFVTSQMGSQQLLISESTVWSGSNFC